MNVNKKIGIIIFTIVLAMSVFIIAGYQIYNNYKSDNENKKEEAGIEFPAELMEESYQQVVINDKTVRLTHYLYDEKMSLAEAIFEITCKEGRPEVAIGPGHIAYAIDSEIWFSNGSFKAQYKGDVLYVYALVFDSSDEFKIDLYGMAEGMEDKNLIEDFEYSNTEEGVLIKTEEGNDLYVSSVGAYIEGEYFDREEEVILKLSDGTERVLMDEDKNYFGSQNSTYPNRWTAKFGFGKTLDMKKLDSIVVNGREYIC